MTRRSLLLGLLGLIGCAPRLHPPGAAIAEPSFELDHLRMADGARLPLWRWEPAGKPIAHLLAIHGMNDYGRAFEAPGAALAAKGIGVTAYDQRGFGRAPKRGLWAGTEAMAADLTAAARLLRARDPGLPLYLLGESMGGAVALAALASADPPPVEGAILSAPGVWGRATMGVGPRALLWITAHLMPWAELSGRELGRMPSDNIEMLRALARDPHIIKETRVETVHGLVDLMDAALAGASRVTAPLLVLYGEKDQIIPPEALDRLLAALPAKPLRQRFALYENGWHMLMRDLQAQTVLDDIAAWAANPQAPLPSNAEARGRTRLAQAGGAAR
ncbi:MAG: lysophospholipase [Rhodospirillales bacterium]|nr:lysophospholipase [Rhodospirillales bacterium]